MKQKQYVEISKNVFANTFPIGSIPVPIAFTALFIERKSIIGVIISLLAICLTIILYYVLKAKGIISKIRISNDGISAIVKRKKIFITWEEFTDISIKYVHGRGGHYILTLKTNDIMLNIIHGSYAIDVLLNYCTDKQFSEKIKYSKDNVEVII